YEAAVRQGWRHAGLPSGPFLVIAPHPDEAPLSSLSHMLATLAPREAFIAADGVIDVARLRSVREPVCVLGTALAFLRLCEELGEDRMALPPGSTAMETGGYKGSGRDVARADLYDMISDKLGIAPSDIFNEYGMTELSSQFYARGPQGFHHGPPWARAVVADPVTLDEVNEGETGILLIYDAANVGSVVGIRTQDLAVKRGDAFELLGRDPSALPRGCSRAADEWMSQ
ncbi:MAG: acyl-protein synthetase, partial [Chthoniobacterales bacterium]